MVLSEAFTLSLQRIARIGVPAVSAQRCNDSVNASLSGAVKKHAGSEAARGVRFNGRWLGLAKPRGASRPPNKRMQRTVETTVSFLTRCRAAADSYSYTPR